MPDRRPKRQPASASKDDPRSQTKACARCGRTMTWRKAWERNWDQVRFCSDACRAHRTDVSDQQLESEILRLLDERGAGKTICPSEAARAVGGDDRAAWEPLMEPARQAARRLVAKGKIVVTQGGHVVDASTAKGPIRLKLR